MPDWKQHFSLTICVTGLALGAVAGMLVHLGNPGNMGLCLACFERDIAGALGLHRAAVVQYLRPEIIGIALGAALAAFLGKELVPRSGSSPAVRFVLGGFVMIGALVFLGCPTRMVLRLGGGDGNALPGLAGFVAGIFVGSLFLKKGFTLGRAYREPLSLTQYVMPLAAAAGVIMVFAKPASLFVSTKGPGAMHAAAWLSLGAGVLIGVLGQRSRLCFAGGIRDMILFRSPHLLFGFVAVFAGVLAINILLGKFHPGFAAQPAAHSSHLWNFLGMLLVGFASLLLGGCPFRQLVLAAQGNGDSALTVAGMMTGAAFAHNFKLAATPKGVSTPGMIAVGIGMLVCLLVAFRCREK